MDARMRIEYERLKRKEKEDSVKRLQMIEAYEREAKQKQIEDHKALQQKLKQEKAELDNYKKQLRENARFKKELIEKSFENLKMKSKSPFVANN